MEQTAQLVLDDKPTILWHSNAPWANTGYGVQTRIFAPRLRNMLDYNVVISTYYGLQGATLAYSDILVLPSYSDNFGNDLLRAHTRFSGADIVLTLHDVWVLDPKRMKQLPWAAWVPIDHYPAPRPVVNVLREGKAIPIAISKFGRRALQEEGFDPVLYVPHSPDAFFYQEIPKGDSKSRFGWEDKFVVSMVAANKGYPSRKSFPAALEAFQKFAIGKKDVLLYLHTEPDPPWGISLPKLVEDLNMPKELVRWVDLYRYIVGLGTPYMFDVYNASDVFLNPAMAEGFGIPIIEAQACGTPVIVTDCTAMSELCFFGQKVRGAPFYTNQGSYQYLPMVSDIVDALEWAYGMTEAERAEGSKIARDAAFRYHPDVVTDHFWRPTLERVQDLLSKRDDLDLEAEEINVLDDLNNGKIGMKGPRDDEDIG